MIKVAGTNMCPNCEEVKEMLDEMGLEYTFIDVTDIYKEAPQDGWRRTDVVSLLAAYAHVESVPLISIHGGEYLSFEEGVTAIKELFPTAAEAAPSEEELVEAVA